MPNTPSIFSSVFSPFIQNASKLITIHHIDNVITTILTISWQPYLICWIHSHLIITTDEPIWIQSIIVVRLSTNEILFKRYFSHTFLRWIWLVIRYWTPNIQFQATILRFSQYLVLEYINSLLSSNDIMANVFIG